MKTNLLLLLIMLVSINSWGQNQGKQLQDKQLQDKLKQQVKQGLTDKFPTGKSAGDLKEAYERSNDAAHLAKNGASTELVSAVASSAFNGGDSIIIPGIGSVSEKSFKKMKPEKRNEIVRIQKKRVRKAKDERNKTFVQVVKNLNEGVFPIKEYNSKGENNIDKLIEKETVEDATFQILSRFPPKKQTERNDSSISKAVKTAKNDKKVIDMQKGLKLLGDWCKKNNLGC